MFISGINSIPWAPPPHFPDVEAVLLDIEGTITKIAFVTEKLFPYAFQNLGQYIHSHEKDSALMKEIEKIKEIEKCPEADLEHVIGILEGWIKTDRKEAPLKEIQGLIWKEGYKTEAFQGHIYPDAHAALTYWSSKLPIYVYSSGSAEAQKLLLTYSVVGNISHLVKGHFDLQMGGKKDSSSYDSIARNIHTDSQNLCVKPQNILFCSDVVAELDAAKSSGMQTCLVRRWGDYPDDLNPQGNQHPCVSHFSQIRINDL
jgi:enolase-phosphatase E1